MYFIYICEQSLVIVTIDVSRGPHQRGGEEGGKEGYRQHRHHSNSQQETLLHTRPLRPEGRPVNTNISVSCYTNVINIQKLNNIFFRTAYTYFLYFFAEKHFTYLQNHNLRTKYLQNNNL